MTVLKVTLPAALVLAIMLAVPTRTHAFTCADGQQSHTATAGEAASANPPGSIVAGVTQVCPGDAALGINNEAGEAKQYLRSILCKTSNFGGAGQEGTIQGLDNKFAVCAAKFLKAASSQLPAQMPLLNGGSNPVCVREGFRTEAQQNLYAKEYLSCVARQGGIKNGCPIACTSGARCEHPRAIAIDVNTNSDTNYQRLWAMGPQFGVNFYLRIRDKVHFVPITTVCSGGGTGPAGTLPTSTYDFPEYYTPPTAPSSPLSNFTNSLRGLFGLTTAPTPSPITLPTQPLPTSQQPFQYLPPESTSTTIKIDTTPVTASSAIDLLNALANPTSQTPPTSTTTAILNPNIQQVSIVQANQNTQTNPTPVVAVQPLFAQQTFVSSDLNNSSYQPYSAQQLSTFQTILAQLKSALIGALEYLKPFKRRSQMQ